VKVDIPEGLPYEAFSSVGMCIVVIFYFLSNIFSLALWNSGLGASP
jgi:hypothetical protein